MTISTSLPLIEGQHFKDHQKDLEISSEAIWKKKEILKINHIKAFPKNLFALDGGIQSMYIPESGEVERKCLQDFNIATSQEFGKLQNIFMLIIGIPGRVI